VSLEKRLKTFQAEVVTKNLVVAKHQSYISSFRRLYLTRRAAEFIFCALIIFGGHQLIIQNGFFSALWPASGVALSALFLRGNNMLLGIFIGTLSSYLYNRYPILVSLHQTFLFTLFIFLTRQLALFWLGTVTPLANVKIFAKFSFLLGLLCAFHIFLISKVLNSIYGAPVYNFDWYIAWIGELNGILCLTPLCLVFEPFVPEKFLNKENAAWWIFTIVITLCHLLFFVIPSGMPSIGLAVFFLIVLCLYAKFFGQVPTCITIFCISIVYLAGVQPLSHLFHLNSSKLDVVVLLSLFSLAMIISICIGTYQQQKYFERVK
jgi:hypothetical protein